MPRLEIIVKERDEGSPTDVRPVGIRCDGEFLTKLFRLSNNSEDAFLYAPPTQLAFWILDNWWRIFHEPEPVGEVTADWLLAHEMSSIGGGYAWPPIRCWGEGDNVGIQTQPSYRYSSGPVRYIADHYCLISRAAVEQSFDTFVEHASEFALEESDTLLDLHRQVKTEIRHPEVAIWRTIEAKLGFDVDEAPPELMKRLDGLIDEFGQEAVSEACISQQGNDAPRALEEGLEAVAHSSTKVELSTAIGAARSHSIRDRGIDGSSPALVPPWKVAEEAADRVRENLAVPPGPISNHRLGKLLGVSAYHVSHARSFRSIPYGVRYRAPDQLSNTVALKAARPEAKRFQLCRVLGDAIWSGNDRLGPISSGKSARQKFQRAFAGSLLCPFGDLVCFIGTDSPRPEDITAAAQRFRVSERLVQTTLANKKVIDRSQFERMVTDGAGPYA